MGILIDSGSPEICNNSINGGSGTSTQPDWVNIGIHVANNAAPYIHHNNIIGGSGTNNYSTGYSYGAVGILWVSSGNAQKGINPIEYNTISGGTPTVNCLSQFAEVLVGIKIAYPSILDILHNDINARNGVTVSATPPRNSVGMWVDYANSGSITIYANKIYGGDSDYNMSATNHDSDCIWIKANASSWVTKIYLLHNTAFLDRGQSASASATIAFLEVSYSAHGSYYIKNNLLFSDIIINN